MLLRIEVPFISALAIGVVACDAKRLQQTFEL